MNYHLILNTYLKQLKDVLSETNLGCAVSLHMHAAWSFFIHHSSLSVPLLMKLLAIVVS